MSDKVTEDEKRTLAALQALIDITGSKAKAFLVDLLKELAPEKKQKGKILIMIQVENYTDETQLTAVGHNGFAGDEELAVVLHEVARTHTLAANEAAKATQMKGTASVH